MYPASLANSFSGKATLLSDFGLPPPIPLSSSETPLDSPFLIRVTTTPAGTGFHESIDSRPTITVPRPPLTQPRFADRSRYRESALRYKHPPAPTLAELADQHVFDVELETFWRNAGLPRKLLRECFNDPVKKAVLTESFRIGKEFIASLGDDFKTVFSSPVNATALTVTVGAVLMATGCAPGEVTDLVTASGDIWSRLGDMATNETGRFIAFLLETGVLSYAGIKVGKSFFSHARNLKADAVKDGILLAVVSLGLAAVFGFHLSGLDPEVRSLLNDALVKKTAPGLAFFLYGLTLMEGAITASSQEKLSALLTKLTGNRWSGLATGTGVTATIQSSSVTTSILVALVASGVMTFRNSLAPIFGANIGTTITNWLLVIKEAAQDLVRLLPFIDNPQTKEAVLEVAKQLDVVGYNHYLIAGGGLALFYAASKGKIKTAAGVSLGLGLVFLGLSTMSAGFKATELKDAIGGVFEMLKNAGGDSAYLHILLTILVGAFVTEVIQSSSASLGITIALMAAGAIDFNTAYGLIFGANVGTTITAVLAASRPEVPRDARKVAIAHVMFNVMGTALLFPAGPYLRDAIDQLIATKGLSPQTMVAIVHSTFNIFCAGVATPLRDQFATMVEAITDRILPKTAQELKDEDDPSRRLLIGAQDLYRMPALALSEAGEATKVMTNTLDEMFTILDNMLKTGTITDADWIRLTNDDKRGGDPAKPRGLEPTLDASFRNLDKFLEGLLASGHLDSSGVVKVSTARRTIQEMEKMGDCVNVIANIFHKNQAQIESEVLIQISKVKEQVMTYFADIAGHEQNSADELRKWGREETIRIKQTIEALQDTFIPPKQNSARSTAQFIEVIDLLNILRGNILNIIEAKANLRNGAEAHTPSA